MRKIDPAMISDSIVIEKVRLHMANLFKMREWSATDKSYAACVIIDPEDPQLADIKEEILRIATAKWGNAAKGLLTEFRANGKLPLRSGDSKASYEGFVELDDEGEIVKTNMYIQAKNREFPPQLTDADNAETTEADGLLYDGAVVDMAIQIWCQDNANGKRINAKLLGVKFVEHNEPLGGGGRPTAKSLTGLFGTPAKKPGQLSAGW